MTKKTTYHIFKVLFVTLVCSSMSFGISIKGFKRNQDIIRCDLDGSTFESSDGTYTNYEWFIGNTLPENKVGSGNTLNSGVIDGRLFVSLILTADSSGYQVNSTHTIFSQAPPSKPNLGLDKIMCEGDSVQIQNSTPYPSFFNFSWNLTPSNEQSIYTSTAGEYIFTVANAIRCRQSDTIRIQVIDNELDLDDISIMCEGSTVTLTNKRPLDNNAEVLWSNGTNTINNEVSTPGTYRLQVETEIDNKTCTYLDSTLVVRKPKPEVILGNDTALCINESLTLTNQSNKSVNFISSYVWNSDINNNSNSFSTNETGVVSLKLVSPDNCESTDDIRIRVFDPSFTLMNDTTLCEGVAIAPLNSSGFLSTVNFKWNGNNESENYQIDKSGKYFLTIYDEEVDNCSHQDSINVTYLSTPIPNLGEDFSIDTSVIIDGSIDLVSNDNVSYSWFNLDEEENILSTDSILEIQESISLLLKVTSNTNNCVGSDVITITYTNEPIVPDPIGPGSIFVPTAFSGNAMDEQNRTFKVMGSELSEENFEVRVYDRWGNIIFSSNDFEQMSSTGWDGSLDDGSLLNGGAYAFVVNATHKSGQEVQKSGTVTFLP